MNRPLGAQARQCDERLTQAFNLLGKRWSGVILGLLLQGPARFAVLARTIPGISERMLSDRLNELARAGLIESGSAFYFDIGVTFDTGAGFLGETKEFHRRQFNHLHAQTL